MTNNYRIYPGRDRWEVIDPETHQVLVRLEGPQAALFAVAGVENFNNGAFILEGWTQRLGVLTSTNGKVSA